MTSLFRNSRITLTQVSCIRRSAGTKSTTNVVKSVQPSSSSANLSQASYSADGTDMSIRDAKQRATSSDLIKPKPRLLSISEFYLPRS